MSDLIKALQIFLKYGDPYAPTHCSHDKLTVAIDPADVSQEDKDKLKELSFVPDPESGGIDFYSYRFGSC
jgi:hypothetical protein